MLTKEDQKHWRPQPEVLAYVSSLIADGAKVLEIGPGQIPFSKATHFIDINPGENRIRCDVQFEPLPFEDKSFDFIYTRHTIEDLIWPFPCLKEMSRVGKAGYIETPSPLAECVRGIDGNPHNWRGYFHHQWLVWNDGKTLKLLKKLPLMEYMPFPDENTMENILRGNPMAWNSHFLWKEEIKWEICSFKLKGENTQLVISAIQDDMLSTNNFINDIKKMLS
jgi:hypothetical protein